MTVDWTLYIDDNSKVLDTFCKFTVYKGQVLKRGLFGYSKRAQIVRNYIPMGDNVLKGFFNPLKFC